MTPEIFAPGVLVAEDGDAINSVFSPDGMEFYYVVLEDGSPRYNLWSTRITGETWTRPGELRLAGEYEVADIALSPGWQPALLLLRHADILGKRRGPLTSGTLNALEKAGQNPSMQVATLILLAGKHSPLSPATAPCISPHTAKAP